MGLFNRFPYTDFHELNLSFILDDIEKLANKIKSAIAGLKLENGDENKLVLKDENDNTISSLVVAYSDHSNTSNSSTTAGTAGTATRASKDVLGNNITDYVKTVVSENNVISFKNANGENIESVSVVTGSVVNLILIDENETGQHFTDEFRYQLEPLEVGDSVGFVSNYNYAGIWDLLNAGNIVNLCHQWTDSQYPDEPYIDYSHPLTMSMVPVFTFDFSYANHPDVRGYHIVEYDITDPEGKIKIRRVY